MIDGGLGFEDAAIARQIDAGRELARGIDAADAAIRREQHLLDRVDPKSPAAGRSRAAIDSHRKRRAALISQLSAPQLQLGRAVQERGSGDHAGLADPTGRCRQAVDTLNAAQSDVARIQEDRNAANAQIGASLRSVVAVAAALLVVGLLVGQS